MPYVKNELRKELRPKSEKTAFTPGELNFQITELCRKYINDFGKTYTTLNDVVGVLECAKLEFSRRLVAPYEDVKIEQNGDVY